MANIRNSPLKKSSTTSKKKPVRGKPEREWICACCGTAYKDHEKNYYISYSTIYAANEGRLPICKTCVRYLFDHYLEEFNGDELKALKRVCMMLDIYYSEDIVKSLGRVSADNPLIAVYMRSLNLKQNKDKTYDLTLQDEVRPVVNDFSDISTFNESSENQYEITEEDITRWGLGFEPQDYFWMNEAYDKMRATNVIDTTTRESLVRDYCKHELLANKAIKEGRADQYLKFSDAAQKTLDRANLTPKLEDASDKAGEKPMGVMIKMFEKERPIPEPNPEWKDVDGIVHFITVYFIGHLCKMMGFKNRWYYLYEEEMEKYRATVPELQDTDDEDIFDSLLSGETKFMDNTPEGRGDV